MQMYNKDKKREMEDKIMAKKILIGDLVEVKEGLFEFCWGVVKHIDDDGYFHVAIFGDTRQMPIFSRDELKKTTPRNLRGRV